MNTQGNMAFLFPGQGSQCVGMGKDFSDSKYFEKANFILGFDLKEICLFGPEEKLTETTITQPAIFTISAILCQKLKDEGLRPALLAGHSLGEYSAFFAAGAIDFEDAVKLVHLRGKYMQQAVPMGSGAMAAVSGLNSDIITDLCKTEMCDVANFNSPEQTVISGKKENIANAADLCKSAGAVIITYLKVSAPFHSRLMQPAADKLKIEINNITFNDALIPVIANVGAKIITDKNKIKKLLVEQVTASVQWTKTIEKMVESGINIFVEIGPGNVLTKLLKRIIPSNHKYSAYNISDLKSLYEFIGKMK